MNFKEVLYFQFPSANNFPHSGKKKPNQTKQNKWNRTAQPPHYSGSELSSGSTNGDKVPQSDPNANHEPNDKFIFSSTSMEFAVSRKIAKYRQKNVSSDDINGHKQTSDGKNNLTGSSSGGSGADVPDGADGADEDINFNKMPTIITASNDAHCSDLVAECSTKSNGMQRNQHVAQQVLS